MEFLSSDYNGPNGFVFMVNHYSGPNTPTFSPLPLDFRPDQAYHEYRIDWTPTSATWFIDSRQVFTTNTYIPTHPMALHLNHWSNGNKLWTQGPPTTDAKVTYSYVKAYFNSSDPSRQKAYQGRCRDSGAKSAVCTVPDQTTPPDPAADHGESFFFYTQQNMTDGQEVYGKIENAGLYT